MKFAGGTRYHGGQADQRVASHISPVQEPESVCCAHLRTTCSPVVVFPVSGSSIFDMLVLGHQIFANRLPRMEQLCPRRASRRPS